MTKLLVEIFLFLFEAVADDAKMGRPGAGAAKKGAALQN